MHIGSELRVNAEQKLRTRRVDINSKRGQRQCNGLTQHAASDCFWVSRSSLAQMHRGL